MKKEHDPTSPFMKETDVAPIFIRDENPRVTHSPVHDLMYKEIEERALNR
jgi:hypothetical protein